MIGRFSKLGAYEELVRSGEFLRAVLAGALALASYLWDGGSGDHSIPGMALALVSVVINGFPIIWGALRTSL
jgi:Zn2+/Cd2+-exporting ATPase